MTHKSTNPTWLDYPGSSSTPIVAAALENLEDAVDVAFPGFRYVGSTAPDTTGWAAGDFWYDTSTES